MKEESPGCITPKGDSFDFSMGEVEASFRSDGEKVKENEKKVVGFLPQSDVRSSLRSAESAMFGFLSANMEFLKLDTLTVENSKLKEFERLTCEVLTNNIEDLPLLAILKTNGWTGSRFRFSPLIVLDSNALFLAFLNLHIARKVQRPTLKAAQRESLRGFVTQKSISEKEISSRKSARISNKSEDPEQNSQKSCIYSDTDDEDDINERQTFYNQIQSFCPNILLSHLT